MVIWTLGILAAAFVYVFIIVPTLQWIAANWIPLVAAAAIGFAAWVAYKVDQHRRKAAFEQSQARQGFARFVDRLGRERWLQPTELAQAQAADAAAREREDFFNRVHGVVYAFRPSMWHENELPYHMELSGWLRAHFPETKVEFQQGSSRPDIVVGDIAVEVKGPTTARDLQTVPDKCSRYLQHFGGLIVAAYDVRVHDRMYGEWCEGISRTWPTVRIVRVDPTPPPTPPQQPRTAPRRYSGPCAGCSGTAWVPFQPTTGRPIYCRDCYYDARATPGHA